MLERGVDGSIVVSVPCRNVAAFRSWLFGLGADAEVLAPTIAWKIQHGSSSFFAESDHWKKTAEDLIEDLGLSL